MGHTWIVATLELAAGGLGKRLGRAESPPGTAQLSDPFLGRRSTLCDEQERVGIAGLVRAPWRADHQQQHSPFNLALGAAEAAVQGHSGQP